MSVIFTLVLFVSIIAWGIGLVNPKSVMRWGQVRTRGRLSLICVATILLSVIMIVAFADPIDDSTTDPVHNTAQSTGQLVDESVTSEDDSQVAQAGAAPSQSSDNPIADADDAHKEEEDSQLESIEGNVITDKSEPVSQASSGQTIAGEMTIHYIDVGQGDATLLEGPNFTILIDAGRHDRNDVVPYLNKVGVTQLDLVIGTHPHADHIGQLDKVLNTFPVTEVWMSGDPHTSRTYERALDAILDSGANYIEPRSGESYTIGSLELAVVNPPDLSGGLNDNSIAIRVQYGDLAFLFTGDAEKTNEQKMVRSGENLQADIYHVGHHGSSTSNTQAFLNRVQPDIAIYSAGVDNSYGHPHHEVIQRLKDMKITIYGTDTHGTIKVTTDGSTYTIATERSGEIADRQSTAQIEPQNAPAQVDPKPADAPAQVDSQPVDAPAQVDPQPVDAPALETETVVGSSCSEGQVNINTASVEQLMRIKHIGEVRAKALIELRPFKSVEDMTRISGIAAKRLSDIVAEGIACVE